MEATFEYLTGASGKFKGTWGEKIALANSMIVYSSLCDTPGGEYLGMEAEFFLLLFNIHHGNTF